MQDEGKVKKRLGEGGRGGGWEERRLRDDPVDRVTSVKWEGVGVRLLSVSY